MSEPHSIVPPTTPVDPVRDRGEVRLALRPGAPGLGYVDGAWWPRTRDLRAELPGLIAALHVEIGARTGPVLRIAFARGQWEPTGRERLVTPTGRVAFSGFDVFEPDLVWVTSYANALAPIVLLVVPPTASEAHALDVLRRASDRDNTDRPGDLLAEPGAIIAGPSAGGNDVSAAV